MKKRAGRFNAGQGANKLVGALIGALIVLTVLLVAVLFIINRDSQNDQEYIAHASELRVLSQEIAKNASEAAGGTPEAFDQLQRTRDEFATRWGYIIDGHPETGLPPSELAAQSGVQENWNAVRERADTIISTREAVLGLHEVARTLNETIPQLQVEYDDIVQILLDNDAPAEQIALAQRQSLLAERIVRSVNNVLSGDEDAVIAADRFGRDAALFGRVLEGQTEGNPAMGISRVQDEDAIYGLEAVAELFEFVSQNVDAILEASPDLFTVRRASNEIFQSSQALLNETSALAENFRDRADSRLISPILAYIILAGLAAVVVLIGLTIYRASQDRLAKTQEQNEQNQNAILRLLDELADLADGDLTTEATVTEDFTGAIADSINYAIDQMRGLVQAIRGTAVRVSSAAQETQATAMHLADASEHQAQEIAGASAAVNEMAVSIDQVSSNAAESSAVAERSVAIAKKGAEVVQNTIRGMDNIREQIQETSKRIKRLGESSQEIGDIVSLINDIADQTNILSLNAAIQASMAGDAGRGFAVVADEVQRLAERSSAATKQIEALVKTIQSDTNEAVISMEHTTAEVVRGARLAQDAGVALEEIENVSMNLAELIQNISNAARQQASSAAHISNTMNVIQEITSQTSSGTNATAKSIGNLAEMAAELRSSVAGFTLPEEDIPEEEEEDSDVPVVS
ncbi:chemotaxis chemoreceptor PilJ [Marinobacter nanhaiticus D15-8W]|uniref:Chemotaxis protein n=1 Tax=Marinobacter nanhaiticus D15-8W TaxID=626887 RepID=N6WV29_9GAMM|nr:methyl-accepting chemotaxis protein [Marinobacter nanhaiticus]ENO15436.1 chemotaxis protein [Marinobacter nanhaiticus D15-8W]BES73714.1 chemotaxis chemoreceptor PilJ [Marinobacter nanhaiticus D15-8W]